MMNSRLAPDFRRVPKSARGIPQYIAGYIANTERLCRRRVALYGEAIRRDTEESEHETVE